MKQHILIAKFRMKKFEMRFQDRAYRIAANPKYHAYKTALESMVYKPVDKKTGSETISTSKMKPSVNKLLTQESYNLPIKKFKKRKAYSRFKEIIWAVYLSEVASLCSKNQGVKYLVCMIDVFTKYAGIKSLKDKKANPVLNGFAKIVNGS